MPDVVTRLNAALQGRYRIEGELGEGGMATVYLARDEKHNRRVALKVLRPELAAVVGAERFLAEIETTANLQHPHILPLFDSGEADRFLYYVMPFVEGESLRARLDRERQLDVDASVHIARAVASALQYAHERGVIHRDIKPENILLQAGEPVVADFGIALAISAAGGGRLTETGLSLGTPHYMSPEQAAADRDLTARSDIYALACVLYEMLAGQPPHTGPTAQSILVRILTEEPRPVTDVRPAVPPHVWAAVAKGLEKLPADRFKGADELAAALGDPSFTYARAKRTASPEAGAERAAARATPWVAALAALTVVLAFSTAWLLLEGRRGGGAEGDAPVLAFVVLDSVPGGGAPRVEVGRDGSLVYHLGKGLYRRPPGALEAAPVADEAGRFDLSPDGRWIVFEERAPSPSRLYKVSAAGGPLTEVWRGPIATTPRWGDDGWIYFASGEGLPVELRRVPQDGGETELLLQTPAGVFLRPLDVLPGGRALLYSATEALRDQTRVMALDLRSRDTIEVVADGFDARWSPTGHLVYGRGGSLWAVPFDPAGLRVTGSPVPVVEGVATFADVASYALSRNGTLAFVSGAGEGEWTFTLADESGNREPLPIGPVAVESARLSPNGGSVAYTQDNDIRIFDLDRGTNLRVTQGQPAHTPVWSSDGSRIAYSSGDSVIVATVDGSREPSGVGLITWTTWPSQLLEDGTLILTVLNAGGLDLFAANVEGGSAPRPLLRADWSEGEGRVSPDGRWLAYLSDRSGTIQVYARSWPDLESETMVSTGDAVSLAGPVWSSDGGTLYYTGADGVVAADLRVTDRLEVVRHRPLPLRGYLQDVHPDGRLLIAERAGGSGSGEGAASRRLIVVTHWDQQLRARMQGG